MFSGKLVVSRYAVCMLVFALAFSVRASAVERRLSLKEAIELALQNNHELKSLRNSLQARKQDIGIARSFLMPRINFEERFTRTNNPTSVFSFKLNQERFSQSDFEISSLNDPEPLSDFQTAFSFEQPILAVRSILGLKTARNEYMAGEEEYVRRKEKLVFNVVKSYLMVNTAKGFVEVAEKSVENAKEHLRIAKERFKTGVGLYSDVLRASTALAEAEQRVVSAKKDLNVAKRALGLLLGLYDSVDTKEDKLPEIPLRELGYYVDSSMSRSDIRSLELRYENTKNSIRIAKSGYLPEIAIRGVYQLNDHNTVFGSEGRSWSIMGILRWNLFDGGRREYEMVKAKYKAEEAEESLEGLKKAVHFAVYDAYLGVEEARKNLELAQAALKTAEEGRRLVKKRYENSLSPLVDLLDAQVNLDRARANLVARSNEYIVALARLSFESGTILKDLGIGEVF
ncbi:Outer membrane protein OprJ [bacterium HR37]|nr:Outer membrane protein OprJ [bacterium HR37]